MDVTSKDNIRNAILKDLFVIHDRSLEMSKNLKENVEDTLTYFRELVIQLSQPTCDPLVTKTPKIIRKRGLQRIETIPENDVLQRESTSTNSARTAEEDKKASDATAGRRSKRIASQRAVDNIRKQNSVTLHTKLRRPIDESNAVSVTKDKNENQNKRKKSVTSSSDDDDKRKGPKFSKLDENLMEKEEPASEVKSSKKSEQIAQLNKATKEQNIPSELQRSNRSASKVSQNDKAKKTDDTIVAPNTDDTEEPSMYEDAIGKPTPIMNSTMKHSPSLSGRRLNATVVLERLSERKLNETVVIKKALSQRNSKETRENANLKGALQDSTHQYKEALQDNMYNDLITDDESSPEIKKSRKQITKKKRRAISTSSDDEVPNTPGRTYFKEPAVKTEAKIVYKSNALFSPYAKESVKKRVEAFEQAVMHSPKSVDTDVPTRITRTKTRAMAAAGTDVANAEVKNTDKNVTQILARKSLAKAKKIAYLMEKQKKDNEDYKEVKVSVNKEQLPERISKLLSNDKPNAKQMYLKLTPLGKTKIVPPTSASRLQTPSNMQNFLNYPKVLTASRANIVTTVDSFIQAPKSITKTNSLEKLEDKKRHEEDARKKRDEALRLQTEEKRRKRQEKELKNKLAREAKERQELEKRQKAEKEKEEKARLAQLMQEKQREEMEKKRLAQLQRAQEKEERRKLEEQQRLQKLQEQEEAERLLAEQRRREQEADKRREVEARAQQQAAAEALRQKNQMLVAQAKYKYANNVKHQGTTNYILDSEPDEDESDDESKPKHEIPDWAQVHVRKPYLAMQRHIREEIIFKFFDTRKCTPDLTELFHGIDRKRLKRTSSAIWKTPPRFSMMEAE